MSGSSLALKNGPVVSVNALQLLWVLEARGCTVRQAEDGALYAGPRHLIADSEREAIRQHKADLLALIAYCEEHSRERL
jgi:hypothetical protein